MSREYQGLSGVGVEEIGAIQYQSMAGVGFEETVSAGGAAVFVKVAGTHQSLAGNGGGLAG